MFSFLNPWFLAAGAAALVPLILHLIQRSRTVQIPFSTIRFLQLAQKRSSNRIRMEHFLLWLLRTLLMLVLAFAFAMPMLRTRRLGGWLGTAARDVAIVLDHSYSMGYTTGSRTVWDEAIETATLIVEGLSDRDRVCVFLADRDVTPVIEQLTGRKDEVLARLRELQPGRTGSQLLAALVAANDALDREQVRHEREIHVVTDHQALPWQSLVRGEAAAAAEWNPGAVDERTAFFVTLLGAEAPENTAPVDAELEPPLIMVDTPARVRTRLTRQGPPRSSTVTLVVNGKDVARRATAVGGDLAEDVVFSVPPLGQGTHTARVETPTDNLPDDNSFYFLVRAREKLPALCIGEESDSFYLRTALTIGVEDTSPMDVKQMPPSQLADEDLEGYACVFLCNALPLPAQDILKLEQFARAGGLLAILPGDKAALSDYTPWTCLPSQPAGISDVPVSDRKRPLRWEQPGHPLLRTLDAGGPAPSVTVRRHLVWDRPDPRAVLATAGARTPLLLAHRFGKGEVLVFAVSADRAWSDLPLSPMFLPLLHRMAEFGAGLGATGDYVWAADRAPLADIVPEAARDTVLLDPAGNQVPIGSTVSDGVPVLFAEGLTLPGIYRLADDGNSPGKPVLAVNMHREESNLTPVDPADLRERLGVKQVTLSLDAAELERRLEDYRLGKTFGEQLLWLALLLAVAEFAYANVLLRSSPRLTETLGIDVSGKVKGVS